MDNRAGKERKDPRAAMRGLLEKVARSHGFGRISRKRIDLDWRTGRELIRRIGLARSGRFTLDDGNEWVYAQLLMWVTGNPAMRCLEPFGMRRYVPADLRKGIYLCGPTGSGKSWATQIMAALAQAVEAGYTFGGREYFIHPTDVRADDICAHYRRTGDLQSYVKDPVLCVQDVGSEPPETLYMGKPRERDKVAYRGQGRPGRLRDDHHEQPADGGPGHAGTLWRAGAEPSGGDVQRTGVERKGQEDGTCYRKLTN